MSVKLSHYHLIVLGDFIAFNLMTLVIYKAWYDFYPNFILFKIGF